MNKYELHETYKNDSGRYLISPTVIETWHEAPTSPLDIFYSLKTKSKFTKYKSLGVDELRECSRNKSLIIYSGGIASDHKYMGILNLGNDYAKITKVYEIYNLILPDGNGHIYDEHICYVALIHVYEEDK